MKGNLLCSVKRVCMILCLMMFFWGAGKQVVNAEELTYLPYEGASYELTYEVGENGVTITGYTGTPAGELLIPGEIEGKIVVEIGEWAFSSSTFDKLTLSEGLKVINYGAFSYCSDLSGKLTIPSTVENIANYAFCNCYGLSGDLVIPSGVVNIGADAFYWCSGFDGKLTIPNSVVSIGESAFSICSGLNGELIIPNSVVSIGEYAFNDCAGFSGDLVISNGVTSIEDGTFRGCGGIECVVLPDGLVHIGDYAFYFCHAVTQVELPDTVSIIGNLAFYSCDSLEEVVIPASVTMIGTDAFAECRTMRKVVILEGVTGTIGAGAFGNSAVETLSIPGSVTGLGNKAFYNCDSLCEINIAEGVESIGSEAFACCDNLQYASIANSVCSIGSKAFYSCSVLEEVNIPQSLISIEEAVFSGCNFLNCIEIPGNVTTIGKEAFYGCCSLRGDLVIPESVISIASKAFFECSALSKRVFLTENTVNIDADAFDLLGSAEDLAIREEITIYAPAGSYGEEYANSYGYNYSSKTYDEVLRAIKVEFDEDEVILSMGESVKLGVVIEPEGCEDAVLWSNSNEVAVEMTGDGIVTAKGYGTSIITLQVGELSDSCKIIVRGESSFVDSTLSEDYTNELYNLIPYPHGACKTSFIDKLDKGGYQTVVYNDGILYIENFNSSLETVLSKQLKLVLPLWGGFYSGKEYNYVVCGNYYDAGIDDGGMVYCIIQYDKEFNWVNSISFSGEQTCTQAPFEAGTVSIDEVNNQLTVYTSRLRLDGHQSNVVFQINTEDMNLIDANGLADFPDVHVSHSFRQIFKYDNDVSVFVDLSDGFPERSVYIQYGDVQKGYVGKALVPISGSSGHNITDAEVSGLEMSDKYYFVVGTYVNDSYLNVYLSCIEKNSGEVTRKWLTDGTRFVPKYHQNPRITKISDNRFVVFWGTEIDDIQSVKYVIMDEQGQILSEVKAAVGARITDCEPIYDGNRIIWLSVKNGIKTFEEISDFEETGSFELEDLLVEAINPWDGTNDTSWYNDIATTFNISTPQQLAGLASLVNNGNDFLGKTVNLVNDIFMNDNTYSFTWEPMKSWQGTFHGNGHKIYNLYTDDESYGGLFNVIGEKGIVKAIDLSQGVFNNGSSVADENYGIIAFCNNYSQVNCNEEAGGICKINYNLIQGCINYGEVRGATVGGIAYANRNTTAVISQCANRGMVSGIHYVGGIVAYNYGWLYNCYNRGMLMDTCRGVGMNYARSLAGIAFRDTRGNHIESCYSTANFIYDKNIWRGVYAIIHEGIEEGVLNCYTRPATKYKEHTTPATVLQTNQMMKESFVDKLNIQTHTVLTAWIADSENLNDGYPITLAEYNAAHGIYKIQPELWMTNEKQMIIALGEQKAITYKCYYNETAPIISGKDNSVAKISYTTDEITIEAVGKGTTYLTIEFLETENNIAQTYQIEIVVNESGRLENPFYDVPEDKWYYPFVLRAYNMGLVSGMGTEPATGLVKFGPEANITREQFVQILYNKEGKPAVEYSEVFSDVPPQGGNVWYSDAIMWASQNNIVSGYNNGKFGVGDLITREQVAVMLKKYAAYKDYETAFTTDADDLRVTFKDVDDIHSWAVDSMCWAVEYGVMSGKSGGWLMPLGNASRAEAATMLLNMIDSYEE